MAFFKSGGLFLADRTAAHSVVDSWHDTVVCLSVCLSVSLCIVVLTVGAGCWKLYCRVPRMALPIYFFRHFCRRMYCSVTTHSEKPNYQNFRVWNGRSQRGHVTMSIPDAAFSAIRFCNYTILRHAQYDRLFERQLRFLLDYVVTRVSLKLRNTGCFSLTFIIALTTVLRTTAVLHCDWWLNYSFVCFHWSGPGWGIAPATHWNLTLNWFSTQ